MKSNLHPISALIVASLTLFLFSSFQIFQNQELLNGKIPGNDRKAENQTELFFVDKMVDDYDNLISDLPEQQVYILDNTESGFSQIADIAERYTNLNAIHIYSHADKQSLNIGNISYTAEDLESSKSDLQRIGSFLNSNADIMLYGCEIGSNNDFINTLRSYTKADIAASKDLTGSYGKGGNWQLEKKLGSIETSVRIAKNYSGVLQYNYHQQISIYHTGVSGSSDLSSFVMLFSGTYETIATTANGGGVENTTSGGASGSVTVPADFVFAANSDGSNPYDFEIEDYDPSTGEITAHIEIPTVNYDQNTDFYMVYGNASVTASQEDVNGTWDDGGNNYFKGVWHLQHTSGTAYDATANGNNGSQNGGLTMNASGKIGGCDDFDGTDDYLDIGSGQSVGKTHTVSAWGKIDNITSDFNTILGDPSDDRAYAMLFDKSEYHYNDGSEFKNVSYSYDTKWHLFSIARNGTSVDFYIDGSQVGSTQSLNNSNNVDFQFIGVRDDDGLKEHYFDGKIDEVRIAATGRSSDWIATVYNNQNNPQSFYEVGNDDTPLPVTWVGFEGERESENRVDLEWFTGSEVNCDYYLVQRSKTAADYTTLGKIPGAGNSNELLRYNYEDTEAPGQKLYYRIKQVDFDGQVDFSKTIAVSAANNKAPEATLEVFPNPTQGNIYLEWDGQEGDVQIEVFDVQGRMIYTESLNGRQSTSINTQTWESGVYHLRLKLNDQVVQRKLFKD